MNLDVNPPLRLMVAFNEAYPAQPPEWTVEVPGRDMWLLATPSGDHRYTIVAPDIDARTVFDRRSALSKRTATNRPLPRWARYPAGVLVLLSEDMDAPGFVAMFAGEEPSGPRYDYALAMGFAALIHQMNDQSYTVESLIDIVDRVRRDYIAG